MPVVKSLWGVIMREENNSGKGNCLYYAYAISLMYHFKSLHSDHLSPIEIYKELHLKEEEIAALEAIRAKPGHFSSSDKKSIESILGPKLRQAAADKLIDEFRISTQNSSLFSAISYEFRKQVKAKLVQQKYYYISSQILVATDPTVVKTYKDAEIYRVPGIKNAISAYAELLAKEIISVEPNGKEIDKFFVTKVHEFFTKNDEEHLKSYHSRLNKNGVWGTEESLCALHRFITGEYTFYVDKYYVAHKRPMSLQIYKNGKLATLGPTHKCGDLILDNHNNVHWVSQISPKKDLEILHVEFPNNTYITAVLNLNNEIEQRIPPP
jgi:hypothetical protein